MKQASDEERPPSKRKNTKVNCGGHKDRAHIPIFMIDVRRGAWAGQRVCYEAVQWIWVRGERDSSKTYWRCYHIVVCDRCNKILDHFPRCPNQPEGVAEDFWRLRSKRGVWGELPERPA